MKTIFTIIWITIGSTILNSQTTPIEVTNKTFKLGVNKKTIRFGFAAGDEIIFDFQVINGKPIKEIDIVEMPGTTRFMDFKTTQIENQRIKVNQKGIFEFHFKNGGIKAKVCKVKISRIPASDATSGFNTSVLWKEKKDTTWITRSRKTLARVDTSSIKFLDRVERVHSQSNLSNSNKSWVNVQLPQNEIQPLVTRKVISWAYWIGVGNEGAAAYNAAKKDFLRKNAARVGTLINPLAGLAVGAYAIAMNPPDGDNVSFSMRSYYSDGRVLTLGSGNSVIAYGKVDRQLQGGFTIELENDNLMNGINVNVKITAVQETKTYKMVEFKEPRVNVTRYLDFAD
ncbi:MAG: hypothetical protein AAF998_22205 [Bacteroidota bacterium]